jgi:YVTN family beta-propeller protein
MRVRRSALSALCLLLSAAAWGQDARLVVGQKISNTVGFYAASGKHIVDVPVGKHPHELAFSPDGRLLYVSDNGILWMTYAGEGGNTISVIDVQGRKKAGVIDLGEYRRPHGMDVDPRTGRLVVTIENPDGLLLVDPAQRKVLRKYDVKGADPHMVLFGPRAEWAYVSNTATDTMAAVHLESGEVELMPTDGRPQGGVLSHDGRRLYLTNSDGNSISIFDLETKQRVGRIETGEGPGRVALTPDGAQLVYNLQKGEAVGFADVAAEKQTAMVALDGPPLSLNLSADGKLAYAGVQSLDKVFVVSLAERKVVQVFSTPREAGPDPALPIPQR